MVAENMTKSRLAVIEVALAAVVQRVGAIENAISDRSADQPVDEDSSQDRRLSKKQLARRWNKSTRSIDRERRKPGFVVGELINGRWFWWLSKVQQYERQCFAAQLGGKGRDSSRFLRAAEQQKEAKKEAPTS
jgi:hypothetical protein